MKAFLMCAGKGERLGELTKNIPKCLLPVNGTPILRRWLDKLQEWKFNRVLVNVSLNYNGQKIIDYIVDNKLTDKVEFFAEHSLSHPLGTAQTLRLNKKFIKNDYCFAVAYSDVWTTFDLRKMVSYHMLNQRGNPLVTMGVYIPETYKAKGIAIVRDGMVTGFEEKPKTKKCKSKFIWAGILVASPEIFSFIKEDMKDIAADLLPVLTKTGRVRAFYVEEPIWDIGENPERYYEINEKVKRLVKL